MGASNSISSNKSISFFEGLNALRFFAAFFVVMHHAEVIRNKNGIENFEWLSLFRNGGNAVTFFFVLSGFLITYLLLKENSTTGTTNIRKFYLKRVLRIWPLYFLLFITGTVVMPIAFSFLHINYEMPYHFSDVWYYFVFFLPGLVTFYFGHHLLEPLWSIGVEEVFYLIWAPIFKFFKKRILYVLLLVIFAKVILELTFTYLIKNDLIHYIVTTFRFEAMAIGGLGAYFVFHRQKSFSSLTIYKLPVQILIYLLLAAYLTFNVNIINPIWDSVFKTPVLSSIVLDFLFVYLIIGVSLVETNIVKFRGKWLSYLGEISYGIYMYHMLIIFAMILVFKKYFASFEIMSGTIIFYAVLLSAVVVVASLSKKFFENYFLNLKSQLDKPEGDKRVATKVG